MTAFLRNVINAPDGSASTTRIGFFLVLGLLVVVVMRWLVTGQDIPSELSRLLEVAIGAVATTKFVQRFAETK
jgi:predicted membrane channel-forming protein YqfA (hemolysin III family)